MPESERATPVVDKNVIAARIEAIERHLDRLSVYRKKSLQEYLDDPDAQDIVEYNLFQIVNHLIDMIQHVVVDEALGFPASAYDGAEILRDNGIFSERECEVSRKMIGFSNIIGHGYIALNKRVVYEILMNGHDDIKRIISAITSRFF